MTDSMLLTLVDSDRITNTAIFEPSKLVGRVFHNRPTIKATVADGKEDLFFKTMLHTHTVKLFSDSNTISVHFTMDCTVEIFPSADEDGEHIVIQPSFEDTDLFNASDFVRMHKNGKVEREIRFICDVNSENYINRYVSDR